MCAYLSEFGHPGCAPALIARRCIALPFPVRFGYQFV